MPVLLLLGAAVAGAVVAGPCALWLRRRRPDAGRMSLVFKSAGLLPSLLAIFLALLSLVALATDSGETGERSPWLTVYVAALLSAYVAVPAFLGGLAAASQLTARTRSQ